MMRWWVACACLLVATPSFAGAPSLRDAASVPAPVDASSASEWSYQEGVETAGAPLSPGRAVLYSLLIPGLGDWKLGNKNRAVTFFAIEGVIWASFIAFEVQGHDLEDEYQSLAMQFAGVTTTDHSDEFYATLRDYDSSDEYEADVKTDGRYTPPYDIGSEALDQYFIDNRVADYEPWLWESTDRRNQYADTRSASKTAYRRADYMIAAAAANRLVSAVFAYAAARSMQKHEVEVNFELTPRGDATLTLTKGF